MGCPPCKDSAWFIKAPRAHFACVLMLSCRNPNICNLNPRCQSIVGAIGFYRICIFLGGLLHAGGVDNRWGKVWSFHHRRRPLRIGSASSWQDDRAVGNPALGQQDEAGDFLRAAAQGIVTSGLFRAECFSCYTEVTQSSIVWTVKHPDAIDTG